MGLISTGINATVSTLKDQYKEFIYCDSIASDTFAVKGKKKAKGFTGLKEIDNNVISNGSVLVVNEGQCALIVENGEVVELCGQAGSYVYDTDLEPSFFTGKFLEGLKNIYSEIGSRFTYGGIAGKDQRVYYFNLKEITGNKYGTPSPVPFRVVDHNIGLDIDIAVRCFGEYSLKMTNPILFYQNVCGNIEGEYKVAELSNQLKSELLTALQPAFAKISEMGIRYSAVVGHTNELADTLNEVLDQKWKETRGLEIASIGISSIKASEEDELLIKQAQRNAMYKDKNMAAATLVGAQAQAMQDAAKNANGAAMGFMGMSMAQGAGGINANDLYTSAPQQPTTTHSSTWTCSCGHENEGNFCSQCGAKKPETTKWFCPQCGKENNGNFCSSCGTKKPF